MRSTYLLTLKYVLFTVNLVINKCISYTHTQSQWLRMVNYHVKNTESFRAITGTCADMWDAERRVYC